MVADAEAILNPEEDKLPPTKLELMALTLNDPSKILFLYLVKYYYYIFEVISLEDEFCRNIGKISYSSAKL